MLTITDLSYRIQGRPLFENASLVLPDGSKTGFVGKNGTGKTTLFHLIQGHLAPETGTIEVNRKARIGSVAAVAARWAANGSSCWRRSEIAPSSVTSTAVANVPRRG